MKSGKFIEPPAQVNWVVGQCGPLCSVSDGRFVNRPDNSRSLGLQKSMDISLGGATSGLAARPGVQGVNLGEIGGPACATEGACVPRPCQLPLAYAFAALGSAGHATQLRQQHPQHPKTRSARTLALAVQSGVMEKPHSLFQQPRGSCTSSAGSACQRCRLLSRLTRPFQV